MNKGLWIVLLLVITACEGGMVSGSRPTTPPASQEEGSWQAAGRKADEKAAKDQAHLRAYQAQQAENEKFDAEVKRVGFTVENANTLLAQCREVWAACVKAIGGKDLDAATAAASAAQALLQPMQGIRDDRRSSTHATNLKIADERATLAEDTARQAITKARDLLAAEQAALDEADRICKTDKTTCAARCAHGEHPFCTEVAYQASHSDRPDFAKAHKLLDAACTSGLLSACGFVPRVDELAKSYQSNVGVLWAAVDSAGSDIATKRFLAGEAATKLRGTRNARAVERMRTHTEAMVQDTYCPAVREFIAVAGRAEFVERARDKCEKDPPSATGLGGGEVTLTTQCRAVFATVCPGVK